MKYFRRGRALVAAAAFVPAAIMSAASPSAGTTFSNWPGYLFDAGHHSVNSVAAAVTPATVPTLAPAWTFRLSAGFFASPTVYNGVVYIGGRDGWFYAISEGTGALRWRTFTGHVTATTCGAAGTTSTATVAVSPASGQPVAYVAGADGYLYALDAATGTQVWRSVVAIPSNSVNDYYNWSSPTVVNSKIYIGISSQCDNPLVRGGLKSYDQGTGRNLRTYYSVPAGQVGASVWTSAAVDPSGSVYLATGNGTVGDAYSLVKLDGATLAKQGIWSLPAVEQAHDQDFGGSPTVFSAVIAGTSTGIVGACNKNGFYYALRSANLAAGPVWRFQVNGPSRSGAGQCDAAALFDGRYVFVAGGTTTIAGTAYPAAVRMLDPATGTPVWERGLPSAHGNILGTPAMSGGGVIAAATWGQVGSAPSFDVFLLRVTDGALLRQISVPNPVFSQPVFADQYLFVATARGPGLTAYRVG